MRDEKTEQSVGLTDDSQDNSKSDQNAEQEENFLNQNALGDLADECRVGRTTNSGGKIAQKQPTISSTGKPRCVCCLLVLVKCLDLFINVSIIGLNSLNFQIRKHLKCSCLLSLRKCFQ